jgi:hypothetical protein
MGLFFIIIGALIAIFYSLILLVKAFQTSVLWGLGYVLVPFVALIFVIVHWETAKKPFLMSLISLPFCFVGFALAPEIMTSSQL